MNIHFRSLAVALMICVLAPNQTMPVQAAEAAIPSALFLEAKRNAEKGDAFYQYLLGIQYSNGIGVPKNATEAVKWFTKAAEQGDADAQYLLGLMYGYGEGVPKNLIQAYKWWNLAAAQGDANAISKRDIAEKQMTRKKIAEAQKLSAEWKPKKSSTS